MWYCLHHLCNFFLCNLPDIRAEFLLAFASCWHFLKIFWIGLCCPILVIIQRKTKLMMTLGLNSTNSCSMTNSQRMVLPIHPCAMVNQPMVAQESPRCTNVCVIQWLEKAWLVYNYLGQTKKKGHVWSAASPHQRLVNTIGHKQLPNTRRLQGRSPDTLFMFGWAKRRWRCSWKTYKNFCYCYKFIALKTKCRNCLLCSGGKKLVCERRLY